MDSGDLLKIEPFVMILAYLEKLLGFSVWALRGDSSRDDTPFLIPKFVG